MQISKVIKFLQGVEEKKGDIQMETISGGNITGFWVRQDPKTGNLTVICATGQREPYDPHQLEMGVNKTNEL